MSFLDDYEPVEDRIRAFWGDNPAGRIHTDLEQRPGQGEYIVKASIYRDFQSKEPDATGYAHEAKDMLPANMKSSALEVCETSAIGRALANLGYAAKGKRPSREEMSKVSGGAVETIAYGEGVIGSEAPPESTSGEGHGTARGDTRTEGSGSANRSESTVPGLSAPPPDESAGVGSGPDGGSESPAPHRCDFVDWPEKPGGWERCNFPGCNAKQKKRAA